MGKNDEYLEFLAREEKKYRSSTPILSPENYNSYKSSNFSEVKKHSKGFGSYILLDSSLSRKREVIRDGHDGHSEEGNVTSDFKFLPPSSNPSNASSTIPINTPTISPTSSDFEAHMNHLAVILSNFDSDIPTNIPSNMPSNIPLDSPLISSATSPSLSPTVSRLLTPPQMGSIIAVIILLLMLLIGIMIETCRRKNNTSINDDTATAQLFRSAQNKSFWSIDSIFPTINTTSNCSLTSNDNNNIKRVIYHDNDDIHKDKKNSTLFQLAEGISPITEGEDDDEEMANISVKTTTTSSTTTTTNHHKTDHPISNNKIFPRISVFSISKKKESSSPSSSSLETTNQSFKTANESFRSFKTANASFRTNNSESSKSFSNLMTQK